MTTELGPVTRAEKAEARIEAVEAQLGKRTSELAECYRLTGSEPAGVESMDADYAVQAVRELREEYDTCPAPEDVTRVQQEQHSPPFSLKPQSGASAPTRGASG